ncbi:MAG TPA: GDP-mannose 4,6-dehydratase [Acidimicrobiales bacterium]|nr:GDP-mannose 4,6-dehydratase [Acidimicrobiales bacterium]
MRALVTGSSGFVGHWLVKHLRDEGDEVVELPESLDIRDEAAIFAAIEAAAPEAVYHLAAQANVKRSWEDAPGTFSVNALGTLNVCSAVSRSGVAARVLLVSSSEVYGKVPPERMPINEDEPLAPVTPYAASKAAAEMVGLQAWLGSGVEVVRARPFNHIGPGQAPGFVVPDLAVQVVRAARGELDRVATGNLDVSRDIVDVRDVVRAYRLIVAHGQPGAAYNVCRGEEVVIADLLAGLMEIAGADVPVWADPARTRAVDVPKHLGDARRLRALTGWRPEIPLAETLGDVLESISAAST